VTRARSNAAELAMGFNRRKLEDQRREAAEKEAANRRVITEAWTTVWQQHMECNIWRRRTPRNMLASKPTTVAPNLRPAELLDTGADTLTQRHWASK
jgi:hypothetical protein